MYNIQQLEEKTLEELLSVAIEMGIDAKNVSSQQELINAVLEKQALIQGKEQEAAPPRKKRARIITKK